MYDATWRIFIHSSFRSLVVLQWFTFTESFNQAISQDVLSSLQSFGHSGAASAYAGCKSELLSSRACLRYTTMERSSIKVMSLTHGPARATSEPPTSYVPGLFDLAASRVWSKGYGAAGYSLLTNVTVLVPGATGYPVHYPASFSLGSQREGIDDMTRYLTQQAAAWYVSSYV